MFVRMMPGFVFEVPEIGQLHQQQCSLCRVRRCIAFFSVLFRQEFKFYTLASRLRTIRSSRRIECSRSRKLQKAAHSILSL